MLTIEPIIACSPISFKHMSFWYLSLESHLTTYQLNTCVLIRKIIGQQGLLVLILNFSKVGSCYKVANLPLPPFLKMGHFYVEANSIIKNNAALESIYLLFDF